MDEFSLIDTYFKTISHDRADVVIGIGDDAACMQMPEGMQLLVSCDTLVADVHFLSSWDAYDIAYKAVMVNVSDIAAMGGSPCWLMLALTMPSLDKMWLQHFSDGLRDSLNQYHVALIGGDMTRGPLSMTLTIHGQVPKGCAVRRGGAKPGDKIYVSGALGAAAFAVASWERQDIDKSDKAVLNEKLLHPKPRIDLAPHLLAFATSAIDISDGLSADLSHICTASHVGACISLDSIPLHPLVKKIQGNDALDFALTGGDDYELCFTVDPKNEAKFLASIAKSGLTCHHIGMIEEKQGLWTKTKYGEVVPLKSHGYNHF